MAEPIPSRTPASSPASSSSASPRGLFIVIDGGEGCGKTTQSMLLAEKLRAVGRETLAVRDPGTTRVGEMIRTILLNPENTEMNMRCEMLLYMAARAQMMAERIAPALDAGMVVISDRFVSSTLAYQIGGDGLSASDINAVGEVAIRGRWPDRVILLDMPVDSARLKKYKDRIERRPESYHQQVRENFLAQAKSKPDLWRVIDGSRDQAAISIDIWKAVKPLLERSSG
jgi:dTMP kinase